jgi:hypothetical protein
MLKKKISPYIFIPIVAASIFGFAAYDDHLATKANETPKHVWTREECLKCHPGEEGLEMMRKKRDDESYCRGMNVKALAYSNTGWKSVSKKKSTK